MQFEGEIVCVEVEVVDAPLNYNLLLGQSLTYDMIVVVSTIFQVLRFSHEGRIITIDHLSFSRLDPSSRASTVPIIENPQLGTINLGVRLFPSLMETFDYPPLVNDVKFISVVPDRLKAVIFQVASFRMSYFNDPWILLSPSTSMEGVGHPIMNIPLSATEVSYNIFQQASTNPDLDPVLKLICAQDSLATHDPLDIVFASSEAILEAMIGPNRPWEDLHHKSYFLPEHNRVEEKDFTMTVNRDVTCPVNHLTMHKIYFEGNVEIIEETIPIDISRTPGVMENIFLEAYCSVEEIHIYTELFEECATFFPGLMRRFQALTHEKLNMRLQLTSMLSLSDRSFTQSILAR
jgi:hypothetical protein